MKTQPDEKSAESLIVKIAAISVVMVILFMLSAWIELAGWRITQPEIALIEALGSSFLLGSLRTAAGAFFTGMILLMILMISASTRNRVRARPFIPIAFGGITFLLFMLYLVSLAP